MAITPEILNADQPKHPGRKLTWEEYLDWCDGATAEWVDGEVVLKMPESERHQAILRFLLRPITHIVEDGDLGEVFFSQFTIRLPGRGREPDIMFVARRNLGRLRRNYLDGIPDL